MENKFPRISRNIRHGHWGRWKYQVQCQNLEKHDFVGPAVTYYGMYSASLVHSSAARRTAHATRTATDPSELDSGSIGIFTLHNVLLQAPRLQAGQRLISLLNFNKRLLRLLFLEGLVEAVGMPLARQLPVGVGDLLLRGAGMKAQDLHETGLVSAVQGHHQENGSKVVHLSLLPTRMRASRVHAQPRHWGRQQACAGGIQKGSPAVHILAVTIAWVCDAEDRQCKTGKIKILILILHADRIILTFPKDSMLSLHLVFPQYLWT